MKTIQKSFIAVILLFTFVPFAAAGNVAVLEEGRSPVPVKNADEVQIVHQVEIVSPAEVFEQEAKPLKAVFNGQIQLEIPNGKLSIQVTEAKLIKYCDSNANVVCDIDSAGRYVITNYSADGKKKQERKYIFENGLYRISESKVYEADGLTLSHTATFVNGPSGIHAIERVSYRNGQIYQVRQYRNNGTYEYVTLYNLNGTKREMRVYDPAERLAAMYQFHQYDANGNVLKYALTLYDTSNLLMHVISESVSELSSNGQRVIITTWSPYKGGADFITTREWITRNGYVVSDNFEYHRTQGAVFRGGAQYVFADNYTYKVTGNFEITAGTSLRVGASSYIRGPMMVKNGVFIINKNSITITADEVTFGEGAQIQAETVTITTPEVPLIIGGNEGQLIVVSPTEVPVLDNPVDMAGLGDIEVGQDDIQLHGVQDTMLITGTLNLSASEGAPVRLIAPLQLTATGVLNVTTPAGLVKITGPLEIKDGEIVIDATGNVQIDSTQINFSGTITTPGQAHLEADAIPRVDPAGDILVNMVGAEVFNLQFDNLVQNGVIAPIDFQLRPLVEVHPNAGIIEVVGQHLLDLNSPNIRGFLGLNNIDGQLLQGRIIQIDNPALVLQPIQQPRLIPVLDQQIGAIFQLRNEIHEEVLS